MRMVIIFLILWLALVTASHIVFTYEIFKAEGEDKCQTMCFNDPMFQEYEFEKFMAVVGCILTIPMLFIVMWKFSNDP